MLCALMQRTAKKTYNVLILLSLGVLFSVIMKPVYRYYVCIQQVNLRTAAILGLFALLFEYRITPNKR